jgi:hypothetical protein
MGTLVNKGKLTPRGIRLASYMESKRQHGPSGATPGELRLISVVEGRDWLEAFVAAPDVARAIAHRVLGPLGTETAAPARVAAVEANDGEREALADVEAKLRLALRLANELREDIQ